MMRKRRIAALLGAVALAAGLSAGLAGPRTPPIR